MKIFQLFHRWTGGVGFDWRLLRVEWKTEGRILLRDNEITDKIVSFYSRLYKKDDNPRLIFDGLNYRLMNGEARQAPFEEEENRAVVFDLGNINSLGLDGMTGVL